MAPEVPVSIEIMHVALLANTAWLDEELAMFRHLVVGLLDGQVRVVQVVPAGLGKDESVLFGDRLEWSDSGWAGMRRRRLAALAGELGQMGVNLIHALDGRVWSGGFDLAQHLGCAAVYRCNSSFDVTLAGRFAKRIDLLRMAFDVATEPLAQAVEQVVSSQAIIERIPNGVYLSDRPTAFAGFGRNQMDDGALCAVISGNAHYDVDYESLFEALPPILADYPQLQLFMDGIGSQHQLWQAARRFGLLGNMSFVPRRLGHRELLLRADVLIHPQALGRVRSLTLQAMAAGMTVVARADPWVDYLIDGQTAWLIDASRPELWAQRLRKLLDDVHAARQLGLEARQWIGQHYPAVRHVDQTHMLYRRVTGESIKFVQEGAS